MTITVEKRNSFFRAEDLLKPDMPSKFVEIIEGELVVMTPAGWKHNRVAVQFIFLFRQFCETHPELNYGGDNDGFLLQREPDVLVSPDASLFTARPMPVDQPWMEFAPEIAVEVLSPSNNPSQIAYKQRKYFDGGTEQVWIAKHEAQTLEMHFRDGRRITIQGDEIAEGEGIASGLQIELKKLFKVS